MPAAHFAGCSTRYGVGILTKSPQLGCIQSYMELACPRGLGCGGGVARTVIDVWSPELALPASPPGLTTVLG